MDNGYGSEEENCDPKLLIFNLENNKLVKTINIPPDVATNETGSGFLIKPFVYVPENCDPEQLLDEMIVSISSFDNLFHFYYNST